MNREIIEVKKMISTLSIDSDVKDSIKHAQRLIKSKTNLSLDLKDIVYLIFKNPERAVELVNENLQDEIKVK